MKFRTCKPDLNETASHYVTKLANYFDRWVDTAQVPHQYKDLREHLVLDQFLRNAPKDLAMFVKERKLKTVSEATRIADEYIDVHRGWGKNYNTYSKETEARTGTEGKYAPKS